MTLTQIKPLGLSKPVDLADNEKIRLGTGSDLQIYHDGSNSYVADTGTGNMNINGSTVQILNPSATEILAKFTQNGSVDLYYDNNVKIQTADVGAIIKDADYNVTLRFETTTGQAGNITGIDDDNLIIQDNTGKDWLNMHKDGQVEIYHNGTKKFETTAVGANLLGELNATGANFTDDGQSSPIVSIMADDGSPWGLVLGNSTFGNNLGLHAYCNNTGHVYIDNIGSGSTFPDWDMRLAHATTAHSMIQLIGSDTSVKLYQGAYTKFQTQASGIDVFGASGTDTQVRLKDNSGNITGYLYSGSGNSVWLLDNQAHGIIKGVANGAVELYYDNVKKAHTYADGFKVDGVQRNVKAGYNYLLVGSNDASGVSIGLDGDSNGDGTGSDYAYIEHGSDGDLSIVCDNPAGDSQFELYVGSGSTTAIIAQAAGEVQLYHNGSEKLITESNGASVTGRFRVRDSGDVDLVISDTSSNAVSGFLGVKTAGRLEYNCYKSGVGTKYPHVFVGYTEEYARIDTNGIKFNGDTASANALDDYEEGQWTPTVNYGVVTSGSNALSYSIQQGWYVKIGGFVQASFYLSFTAMGDGNDFTMGGLPFTSVNKPYNNLSYSSSGSLGYKDCNFTNNATQLVYVGNNAANIYYYNNNAGTHSPAATKLVSTAHIASALYGSVSYRAE